MKRVTTGAYMASAMVRSPNRNGPPDLARHSRQIVQTRSMSDCARDQILKPGKWPFRLTGSDDRSRISARAEASSGAVTISSNSSPENLVSSQPRSDQDE